ncbi:hypothetical protein OKW42_004225 [Paraburkholderia sp. WC7.3d]
MQSINASGHKYGLVPPGLGWVVFRERKVFSEELVFYVNYLGGEMPTATLNFSRNALQVAVQYYMFLRHGFEGYRRIMQHTLDNAIALRGVLVESGYFTMMNGTQPDSGRGRDARQQDQKFQRVRRFEQGARRRLGALEAPHASRCAFPRGQMLTFR